SYYFFSSSRRRHTRSKRDWSSDVCSSDLGKTEIYLQAIEQVIQQGKEAIVLVPEISLTPMMVERFKGRFGSEVAVLHSALSIGEKYDEWRKVLRKEVSVVVGARSAI